MSELTPEAKRFLEAHRQDGLVWAVWHGESWHLAPSVTAHGITWETVYLGTEPREADEPKAYLASEQPVMLQQRKPYDPIVLVAASA